MYLDETGYSIGRAFENDSAEAEVGHTLLLAEKGQTDWVNMAQMSSSNRADSSVTEMVVDGVGLHSIWSLREAQRACCALVHVASTGRRAMLGVSSDECPQAAVSFSC